MFILQFMLYSNSKQIHLNQESMHNGVSLMQLLIENKIHVYTLSSWNVEMSK